MKRTHIFILVVAAILSACSHSVPAGSIIIDSSRENTLWGDEKIYAVDEKGIETSISVPLSNTVNAQWSPDRQWIVYQTYGADSQVIVVSADGSKTVSLTNDMYTCGLEPAWSPDGNWIAAYFCTANASEQDGIYIVDVSAIANGEVSSTAYRFVIDGTAPSWSSDSRQLAFEGFGVSIVSVTSPGNIKVISPKDMECYEPDWSPISNEIVMSCLVPNQGINIFLEKSDGSGFRNITNTKSYDLSPKWSPDGTKIVFISDRFGSQSLSLGAYETPSNAVFIMNSNGTNVAKLSSHNDERIQWIDWVSP